MSRTVSEIMDHKFVHASEHDSISGVLQEMSELGLGSIPVLDASGRAIGMATVSDIDRCRDLEELTRHLQHPAVTIPESASIDDAARTLAAKRAERLVLVDGAGVAVGAVSALDVLRALLGFGITHSGHPGAASASDHWSPSKMFDADALADVPKVPGLLVLARVIDGEKAKLAWVESTLNLHDRLAQMLRTRQEDAALRGLLSESPRMLAFRVMVVADDVRRGRVSRALQVMLRHSKAVPPTAAVTTAR
jgi:CBS domain-containing protein